MSEVELVVENLDADTLSHLLGRGADTNETGLGGWDWSLLHLAIDAEVDDAAQDGTPLRVDITRMLVAAGANPNHRSTKGETALDMARRRGHYMAVEVLEPVTESVD